MCISQEERKTAVKYLNKYLLCVDNMFNDETINRKHKIF